MARSGESFQFGDLSNDVGETSNKRIQAALENSVLFISSSDNNSSHICTI